MKKKAKHVFDDPTGLIQKLLSNSSSWEKMKMSVFASVTNLYHQYEKINGRIPEESVYFTVNHEGTKGGIVVKPYST